jgi:hypothetical protein
LRIGLEEEKSVLDFSLSLLSLFFEIVFFSFEKDPTPETFRKKLYKLLSPPGVPDSLNHRAQLLRPHNGILIRLRNFSLPSLLSLPDRRKDHVLFFLIFFKGEENSRSEFDHFRSSGKRRGEKMKNKLTLPIAFCSVALNGFPLLFDSVAGSRSVV